MNAIRVTRSFLRKPLNSALILVGIVLLIEAVKWSVAYGPMLRLATKVGGFSYYAGVLTRSIIIPNLFTTFITVALINRAHKWFKVEVIPNDWNSVARYELRFLPIFGLSFLIFNPVTQAVRYLLIDFPKYSFPTFWQERILGTFTWEVYFNYLFPVLLIGYTALNISLLQDFLQQRREAQEAAEAKVIEAEQVALRTAQAAQEAQRQQREKSVVPVDADKNSCLAHLRGKNATGELAFPIEDVHFFTVEERYYYAELLKGRYLIGKTLNELEAELDSTQFFRIKRDYIVNRQSVLDYAYWENGKYIVRINTPDRHEIVVPRARMQEFREWLQGSQRAADQSTGSLVLAN